MNLKIFYVFTGGVLLTIVGYVVGLIIGMNIGGNFLPNFEFMSGQGYEATAHLGGIIGAIVGLLIGIWLGTRVSKKKI